MLTLARHSVVVATGLMALVDDCITERWGSARKPRRLRLPSFGSGSMSMKLDNSMAFVQQMFARQEPAHSKTPPPSPPVAAC